MANDILSGKNGHVKIGTSSQVEIMNLKNWKLDISREAIDANVFGDSWAKAVAGLGSWTCSCEGFFTADDTTGQIAVQAAFVAGTKVTVNLYTDNTNYFTGEAYIVKFSPSNDAKGTVDVSIEFKGNGAIEFEGS